MKTIKESMNLDYSDFDYKKFENWITRYLDDCRCVVNTVEIICDNYAYDIEINVEHSENLPSRISDKDYGAFIFDAMYTTDCLYLKMPVVRAMKIAEDFSPQVLKVKDDSILIGDSNSDTEIWLDVWTDDDGYVEWDYNQQSFNLNKYEDLVQKYLQQNDDFFYALDSVVSDNFPLTESKKSATKSIKESINGDCYIYYDDDDGKRNVFCDYVKGITDTRSWFYLNEYIIDAIHVFKNEKQAQKFIDEHLKYFADQDKVVIAEYPQTVDGFFESKKSATKSLKEGRVDKGAVTYEFTCLLNNLGYKGVDYSNEENNEKCDDIIYMIMDLLKTMPRL